MAILRGMFGGGKAAQRDVEAALARIERNRETVRVEIERTLIRFNTRLSVRNGSVVIAKPPALGQQLAAGSFVRFKVPGAPNQELRLEVATGNFNLTNNQPVFLCRLPSAFAKASQRKAERFDTTRFQNLRLLLPGHEEFRMLDVSESGCRALTQYQKPSDRLKRSDRIGGGQIAVGRNVRIALVVVVPRTYQGKAVGCAFTVDPGGENRKLLNHLLKSLETAQREAMRADAPA